MASKKETEKTETSAIKRSVARATRARRPSYAAARAQRGSAGAGRSAMSKTPAEETRQKLDGLRSDLSELQEDLLLADVQNDLADTETALSLLPTEVEELRTRGYVFRSFLERKMEVLARQWEEVHDRVAREVTRRTRGLEREADAAEGVLRQAMGGRSSQIQRAESAVDALESKVGAARSAVQAMYRPLEGNVAQTRTQVEQIRWLLDQIDEGSFRLHPAEDPFVACKAQYMETKKEGPKGVLYLTDERLLFEQKEEVATKKVLFITTEKETVQQLILDVPVGQIEEITASDKGFLGRKEMLELAFAPEADLSDATLRLHGADNEEWSGLIGRVKSGEIAKERTQPKDEVAVEAMRAAPTKCPTCGASISVEIVRGMREMTCAYCGTVIRL